MHRLLLLRHAKSSHKDKSLADFDRPLNRRGRKDCTKIGRWLSKQPYTIDMVISSPAKRTKQTVRRVIKVLGKKEHPVKWEPVVYDASAKAIYKLLAEVPEEVETVLLVGHHQALESIILRKSEWADIPAEPKLIPTAAVAIMEFSGPWSEFKKSTAKLKGITRPRQLHD